MGGGNTVGQISGQASGDATRLTGDSITAMANRYQQLGLGGVGATPTSEPVGGVPGVPGSGTSSVAPGQFATGSTGGAPAGDGSSGANLATGAFGNPVAGFGGLPATSGGSGPSFGGAGPGAGGSGIPGIPTGGPTAFEMDAGVLPSWTGGIPQEFQGALGEAQFQDLGQTASAAAGSAQAKGQTLSSIGQIGGLIGGLAI